MVDGFGSITWWGFSPALDLQDTDVSTSLSDLSLTSDGQEEINILLVGSGDSRHILATIAKAYRHRKRKMNFYIIESHLELYARHLLFLTIALEPQTRMGLQEKTEMFLELYGNSLVRLQSMSYVQKMATLFIKMVTDFDFMEKKMPIVDMTNLKFKERDILEAILKFWRDNEAKSIFDVEKCWDLRLRRHLGERYDAIPNVFDWDFNMKLAEKDAGVIGSHLYLKWRQKGIAFEIREGTYDTPNKTLSSVTVFSKEGERQALRGYWGDIVVSPYITFGIESEEKSFFKKSNNVYTKTGEDVSQYNVLEMLHEIAHGEKYVPPQTEAESKPTATLTEITEESEEAEKKDEEVGDEADDVNPLDREYEPITLDNVKVTFLPLGSATEMHKKSKFQNLFHVIYFSNSMGHTLMDQINKTFKDKASVIVESPKFMLELKEDQHKSFLEKIVSIAQGVGCKVAAPCELKDNFAKFTYKAS